MISTHVLRIVRSASNSVRTRASIAAPPFHLLR
jgi:hypothetical protein